MPVFGKGRINRKQNPKVPIGKRLSRLKVKGIAKRVFSEKDTDWSYEDTALLSVSKALGIGIDSWVKKRFSKNKKLVVVLDWGCGTGTAISSIAKRNGSKVRCYGFADESYPEWRSNKKVKFIQETAENLPRYFKDSSVDIIFSHLGLEHYQGNLNYWNRMPDYWDYLSTLAGKLKKGGLLVTTMPPRFNSKLRDAIGLFEKEGLSISMREHKAHELRGTIITIKKK